MATLAEPRELRELKTPTRNQRVYVPLLFGVVVLCIGIAFGEAYPFIISGDGMGYFELIATGKSSTLYQSGYPFLFIWTKPLSDAIDVPHILIVRIAQYVFVAMVSGLYVAATIPFVKVWGSVASAAFVFINQPVWVYVNTTRAEWFAGILGIVLLSLTALYILQMRLYGKVILAFLIGSILAIGYVAKANFIAFGAAIVPLIAWEWFHTASMRGRRILLPLLASMLGFSLIYIGFVGGFHQRSVNDESWLTLTYQQGWNLMVRLGTWQGKINAEDGRSSAQLVWLNQVLPENMRLSSDDYENISRNVSEAPQRATPTQAAMINAALRAEFPGIIELIDKSGLTRQLKITEWPTNVILTTQYYLGLPKSQKLMIGAFVEAVKNNPASFANSVMVGIRDFWTLNAMRASHISAAGNVSGAACSPLPATGEDYSRSEIDACVDRGSLAVRVTSFLTPSPNVLAAMLLIAVVIVIVSFFVRGRGELKTLLCVALSCIVAQSVFSAIVFGNTRIKELFTVYPTVLAMVSLSACLFVLIALDKMRRVVPA